MPFFHPFRKYILMLSNEIEYQDLYFYDFHDEAIELQKTQMLHIHNFPNNLKPRLGHPYRHLQ